MLSSNTILYVDQMTKLQFLHQNQYCVCYIKPPSIDVAQFNLLIRCKVR